MKDSLKAVLFLLLFSLVNLLVLLGGYALYLASGLSRFSLEIGSRAFLGMLILQLPLLLPLALALALFLTFLRLKNRPGIRVLTFLLLFLFSWGLLWTSGFLLEDLKPGETAGPTPLETLSFVPGEIRTLPGGNRVYVGALEEGLPASLAAPFPEPDRTPLLYFPRTRSEGGRLYVRNSAGRELELEPRRDASSPKEAGPFPGESGSGSPVFSSFSALADSLASLRNLDSLSVYLFCLSTLALYLSACWGFIRISRWPFLNALLVLMLLSGAGGIHRVFSSQTLRPLEEILQGKTMGIPVPFLALAVSALVLILLDLLFIPYRKRMEEENE